MPHNNKVILCHNGGCLSPRLLVGFNGIGTDLPKDVQLSEDVILDFISDDEAESRLQGSRRCLLYMEQALHSPMCLVYRLDGRLYRQELRERGQELKQLGRAITVPDGQIRWRMLMPGPRLLHVQRLARVLAPHVTQLLADAEAHPGFRKALPDGEQLHSELLQRNPLIAPNPQGIFICLLSSAGYPVHAIIVVNMKGACLELSRMDDTRHKNHVASLQDALDRLPEMAATHTVQKPQQAAVYSLHADTCGVLPGRGDIMDASALGPVHQHCTQRRSPISRVLYGTAVRSNKVVPLTDEDSARPAPQAPQRSHLVASNCNAQHWLQLQASVSSADAPQQAVQSPLRAATAAADPLPASPCRSPFARGSLEQERESLHIQRALELIRLARGPSKLWEGLRQLKADRGTARSGWADEWISYEALEAMVIWAANQDSIAELDSSAMGKAVSREAAALLLEASNENAAARRLVAQMNATLAQSLPSMALLQLFLDLIEIPSVKQAAALGSLAEKLAAHLEALWPVCDVGAALDGNEGAVGHAQSGAAKHGAPRKLSLSPKRRSPGITGDGDKAERNPTPDSPSQSWRESPRPEGITLAKPGCKPVFVPKLTLPAVASPKDPGAHSRGSRLGLGSQGSGTFAVTPLQRLLSPSFLTPDTTFRLPGETAQEGACARLTALGRHVGSGLMAADMAVMLAQKRRESLARAEALVPHLSLPVKNLMAHRIEILTDRSIADSPVKAEEHSDAGHGSEQSSPVRMSSSRASVARRLNLSHTPSSLGAPRAGLSIAEEQQVQLPALLMQSILSAKPATSGYKGTHSLAKVVTSQLLTLCRGRDSESAQLRTLCMALLQKCAVQWQDPREMLQTLAWRSNHGSPSQHILFPAIAHELQTACQLYAQGMPLPALERAERLLGLAHQFLQRSASPALLAVAEAHLAEPLSQILALLAGMGPFSDWHAAAKSVLHVRLQLSAIMLQRCKDAGLGRRLISWALQDCSAASFTSRVFSEATAAAHARPRGASGADVCCSFAHYYTALAGLLSRQPGLGQATIDLDLGSEMDEDCPASSAPCARGAEVLVSCASGSGLGAGPALTRHRALSKLAFLIEPPLGVITCMLDQAPPASGAGASLQTMAALRLLRALFSAPGNPFVSDWALVDFYAQYHFLHFARLFHDLPGGGPPLTALCEAHLQVLRAMAGSKSRAVRQQFMQLHVLDMLVRELSLEYEAQQVRPPPAARLTSSTSSSAGDLSAQAASCAASPALSRGGALKIPRLHLSPAPSATATELRGVPASRPSPAPSGAAKVPPLRLSPAPSGGFLQESRAGSAVGQPSRSGSSSGGEKRSERAEAIAALHGVAPFQAPGMPQKVPALHLPGRLKASKPPLGSSRATPRMQLTARSAGGLLTSARPSSAPLGSARSSPTGPLTPAMAPLERTVSAAAALAQSAESPGRRLGVAGPHTQQHLMAGQVMPREQTSWRGKAGKVPSSPFAATITADSRSHNAETPSLNTSCATVPERSDEADQDSSPGEDSPDDAQSRPPDLAIPQQGSVPLLRLDNLPPESEEESSGLDANSDGEAAAEAPDGDVAGNASNGLAIKLTGDADEDVRRMLALEGYDSDSSSYSSDNGSMDGDARSEAGQDGTPWAVPALDLTVSTRLSQRSSPEHTPVSQAGSGQQPGQLGALERLARRKGKMQAAAQRSHAPDVAPLMMRSYLDRRAKRLLYADKDLHVLVLETVLELLLSEHGQLDAAYCCLQPLEQRRQNVLYMLGHHLNHPANAAATAPLLERAADMGQPAVRLLRILCARLFCGDKYLQQKRIARGAYAEVFSCSFTEAGRQESVVLKVMDMPKSVHDSCRQVDIFSEIAILERFRGRPGMCQLLDYGLDGDDFIMVLRHYSGSLKAWRDQMPDCPDGQLRMYLQIFGDIVSGVQDLEAEQVVHFDLKCDNILLEPLETTQDPAALPFRVVLSDFGESRMYATAGSALTVRNRGTEYMKSPEMLVVGNATKQTRSNHDRRRREGAGTPADVWALGCLLYELLTGRILFYDPDWIRFFIRLTQSKEDIIPADRMAAVAHLPGVGKLLRCMLVRDPARRATLADVSRRVHSLLESAPRSQHIPEAFLPAPTAPSRSDSSSMRLQPSGSNASAMGISAQYSLAEHYLDTFTPVAERLLLGSTQALEQAQQLADHRVSHAIILCCGPEEDGGISHRRQPHAAHNPEWLQGDTFLASAIVSCVAADVKCKVIPIGPLPSSQASCATTAEQGLLRAMPAILRLISSALEEHASCEGPCWDRAGSPSRAPNSPPLLPGQAVHHSRGIRQEPGNVLLAAAAGYEGEAAVATIAHIMRQQRLSPYDATLAARYQHSALHLQEHNERQLTSWASFAVSPGQAQPH